jgi:hypothetical protein
VRKVRWLPKTEFQSVLDEVRGRIYGEGERITTNLLPERERQESAIIVPDVPTGRYSNNRHRSALAYENSTGPHSQAGHLRSGRATDLTAFKDFDVQCWIADTWYGSRIACMGHYDRHQHEICIFAVRGEGRLKRKAAATEFKAPVTRHSEKPDAFYTRVQSWPPPPHLDVFASKRQERWDRMATKLLGAMNFS